MSHSKIYKMLKSISDTQERLRKPQITPETYKTLIKYAETKEEAKKYKRAYWKGK